MSSRPPLAMPSSPFREHLALLEQDYTRLEAEIASLKEALGAPLLTPPCATEVKAPDLQPGSKPAPLPSFPEATEGNNEPTQDEATYKQTLSSKSDEPVQKRDSWTRSHTLDVFGGGGRASTQDKRKPVFANAEEMKEQVRQAVLRKKYDVADFYSETGCAQFIATHPLFEAITLSVIGLNALWIAIDTDFNHEDLLIDAHPIFLVMENLFCVYFTVELAVRFAAFRLKQNCLQDGWFLFDSTLVLLMISETWVLMIVYVANSSNSGTSNPLGDASVLRIVRLLRLTRMARVGKLLVAMPELVILLKGMAAAARSVMFTLLLLLILLYVFAIAFTQALEDTQVGADHYPNVGKSMHTLWLYGTLLDEITYMMAALELESIFCVILMNILILCASLTVMNMLIGVLVNVVQGVAEAEKEELVLRKIKEQLQHIMNDLGLDADNSGGISKEEFVKVIENHEAARAMSDLGVDVVQLIDKADALFDGDSDDEESHTERGKELTFPEFMDIVLDLRGENPVKLKDMLGVKVLIQDFAKRQRQDMRLSMKTNGISSPRLASSRVSSSSSMPGSTSTWSNPIVQQTIRNMSEPIQQTISGRSNPTACKMNEYCMDI